MKTSLLTRVAGFLVVTVTLLSRSDAWADLDGPTIWGSTGLIAMPTARMAPLNRFRITGSYVFNTSSTAGLHTGSLSLLDNLEFGLLYGVGLPVQGFSGLAGHIKWLAVKPSVVPLSLAFGGDLLGMGANSGYYYGNSLYGVISYEFSPLVNMLQIRPHFGITGNALGVRMMAGLEVPLLNTVLLAGEYHSQQGRNGDYFNFGTRFNLPMNMSLGLFTMGRPGRSFGDRDYTLQVSFQGGVPFQVAGRQREQQEPVATVVSPPPAPPTGLIATTQEPVVTPGQLSTVTGQLFDEQSHNPLAGLRVFIKGHGQVSTTDPQGRFAISDIPPGSRELIIQQPTQDVILATRPLSMVGGQNFLLELLVPRGPVVQKPAALSGQVLNPDGLGLAGAEVSVSRGQTVIRTVAGPEGTFHLSSLPPGDYQLHVEKPGWAPVTRPLQVTGQEPLKLNLTLKLKTGTISGLVLDPRQRGVARVQVRVEDLEGVAISTGSDGSYILKGVPPGSHRLTFSQGGRVVFTTSVTLDLLTGTARANATLGAVPAPALSPAAALSPAPRSSPAAPTPGTLAALSGRITDPGARPLSGARVMVESGDLTAMTLSGADGSFQIRELPPGNYKLTVTRNGFVTRVIPMQLRSKVDRQTVTLSHR